MGRQVFDTMQKREESLQDVLASATVTAASSNAPQKQSAPESGESCNRSPVVTVKQTAFLTATQGNACIKVLCGPQGTGRGA